MNWTSVIRSNEMANFHEILSNVIEDIALADAIQEGEATEAIGKQEILDVLPGENA